ncbi:MAG: OmpA family protein [Longimicrobiales bacterium]
MKLRGAVLVLAVATAVTACSGNEEPEQPAPPPPPAAPDTAGQGQAALDAARADSIARAREAEAATAEETARARAILEELVYFDYDESAIRADAQETLSQKVAVLRANPDVALRITGHADERGSIEYNLALGLRRANSVRDYLVGFGLDASRFTTETMGEDRPLDPGTTEAAYARNRRGEFTITRGGDRLTTGTE